MTGRKFRGAWKRRPQPAPVVIILTPPAAKPLTAADRARIAKWIRDRVVADWRGGCWHCRRPFIAGQKFVDVRGDETTIRFHVGCHDAWLAKQETLARRALGLTEETCGC
jgi:hypothetical protein